MLVWGPIRAPAPILVAPRRTTPAPISASAPISTPASISTVSGSVKVTPFRA